MYVKHPVFKESKSLDISIWRYMDFWKFLNLLDNKALFFSNSENLGDRFEGRIPPFVLEKIKLRDEETGSKSEEIINYIENVCRKTFLISSWSYAERESFALWKMYAKNKSGVAIQTDLYSLKESFNMTTKSIYIGEINYIHEKKYFFDLGNLFYPFMTKFDFYSFENELRCITVNEDYEKNKENLVDIDLKTLIKKVHISQSSKPEFVKLIEQIKKEHNLNFEICYSKINDSWL
ncbi:hypothetical protein [Pedobacter glucosidilyticus]|uniref:hypothetical protein n=1 Tax=Pedobacter glucosidilyticus TaxID=1122941 RepID=UPI00042413B6|nr:hypothetical protein [Pedobacter glucosidilyticus]